MKQILLAIFFFPALCLAQEFAPIGAKWHNHIKPFASSSFSVARLTYEKDSIIDGKNCQIVTSDRIGYACNGLGSSNQKIFFFEGGELYYYTGSDFNLMIDFNAGINDSWVFHPNSALVDSIEVHVDSISYHYLSNQDSLRIQHVTARNINQISTYTYETQIYERIGFLTGLYPDTHHPTSLCDGPLEGPLRCYEDDDIGLLKFDDIDCDSVYVYN